MLQIYGMKLGLKLLAKGDVRRALHYLVIPVNYWRALEYGITLDESDFRPGERVLDLGSPKVLGLYLAAQRGAEVYSTDIDDYFVGEFERLRVLEGVSSSRYRTEVQDGRKLTFPDNHFNKIFSISVIEHIPGTGDVDCACEIGRVLAPGGRCVITVPFAPDSRDEYKDAKDFYWANQSEGKQNGKVFFQRRYSQEDLFRRLVEPSGLRLVKLQYMGEQLFATSDKEICERLPAWTGPIQPMLSRILLKGPVNSWRTFRKPLAAVLVLEKSAC